MCTAIFCLFALTSSFAQGVTTSSIFGQVTDQDGTELIGANVTALHVPSGTLYGNSTDASGFYRIPNMRVGGPYTITVSYTGFETFTKEGLSLSLGQSFNLSPTLGESGVTLGEVVVTAKNDIFDGGRTGQETVIDADDINNKLPTISRSIADFARANPLVSVDEGGDGFELNIAGQNERYNAIYIDGTVNNDVFGLAGSGTDGGQTGAGPISIDAIDQIQVSVAPYDVRLSGFAGGAINAVTRSGTNEFQGSAYYFLRNEQLAGLTPDVDLDDEDRTRLNDFSAQTYGFRLGGPIIKNKLFFFVNAELQRDEIPEPFPFEGYNGDASLAQINAIEGKLNEFGYDPGTFTDNATTLDKNFLLMKLDWNINPNNKFSVRYFVNDIENLEARNSSPNSVNFENGSEFFASTTHNGSIELNSIFGTKYSNSLKAGFKIVRDDRDVFGADFPNVRIEDGGGRIEFGGERFSSANLLNQDVFTLTNDFQIFSGRHNITIGTQNEFFSVGNLFIRENFGAYQYRGFTDDNGNFVTGIDQFLNDLPASQYDRSFSQVDNIAGDESAAIADFSGFQLGFYIQDEYQATDRLRLTGGLRLDIPVFPDDVPANDQFNNETIPLLEAQGYDLKGARTGQFIDQQFLFSPRLGFNLDVTGDRSTQLRGGIGIFTSRQPLVWFGGAYNNYGFNVGGTRLRDEVVFNPDPQNQPIGLDDNGNPLTQVDLNDLSPSGQIDLFASDIKLPQVMRANIAVDQKLPLGLIGTAEFLYTDFINNIFYESLNLRQSTENLTGTGDDRPIFNVFDEVDDTYTGIFLASNTSEGNAYNVAFSLTKPEVNGFSGTVSYSYGDAFSLNDATSSQNNSQWRGYRNVAGRNFERDAQRSAFSPGHRVFANLSYRAEYADFGATQISIAYNGQSGRPYTYTIDENGFGGMVNDGAFNDGNPFYIPTDANDIILQETTVNGKTFSVEEQYQILNDYIENDDFLSENRGGYAETNTGRAPFTNIIDLKLIQEFTVETAKGKENTLQLTFDVFNFTNLLGNAFGENWGQRFFNGSFGNVTLVRFRDFEEGTNNPIYTVDNRILEGLAPEDNRLIDTGRLNSSRWQAQVGVRYIFN